MNSDKVTRVFWLFASVINLTDVDKPHAEVALSYGISDYSWSGRLASIKIKKGEHK
jgi:hypothetical protein